MPARVTAVEGGLTSFPVTLIPAVSARPHRR
jgi:hypothetical protein